ncbi:MAG: hypothetical protein ABIK56_01005 [candidate division WOR-3 bacterium]
MGYYKTPEGYAQDVYVSFPYAYVANGDGGLQIYQFYGTSINKKVKRRKQKE